MSEAPGDEEREFDETSVDVRLALVDLAVLFFGGCIFNILGYFTDSSGGGRLVRLKLGEPAGPLVAVAV